MSARDVGETYKNPSTQDLFRFNTQLHNSESNQGLKVVSSCENGSVGVLDRRVWSQIDLINSNLIKAWLRSSHAVGYVPCAPLPLPPAVSTIVLHIFARPERCAQRSIQRIGGVLPVASQQSAPLIPGLTLPLWAVDTLDTFGPTIASCTSQNSSAVILEKQYIGTMEGGVARRMRRRLLQSTDVVSLTIAQRLHIVKLQITFVYSFVP